MNKCESSTSWNRADHCLIARRTESEQGRDKQHFSYLSPHSEGTNKTRPLNGSRVEDCPSCQQYWRKCLDHKSTDGFIIWWCVCQLIPIVNLSAFNISSGKDLSAYLGTQLDTEITHGQASVCSLLLSWEPSLSATLNSWNLILFMFFFYYRRHGYL